MSARDIDEIIIQSEVIWANLKRKKSIKNPPPNRTIRSSYGLLL
jgi:hypothetical protein